MNFRSRCFLRAAWAVLLVWRAAGPVAAQQAAPADSAAVPAGPPCPPVVVPRRRAGFVISLDNRDSFVQSSAVRVIGLNAGVVLPGRRWRVGLGAYTLSRSYTDLYIYQYRKGRRTKKILDTLTPSLSLSYFTPNLSYVFLQRRWLEVSVPLEVGLGSSHYTITNERGSLTTDNSGLFVPVEIGLAVLLKPTRWVGVSGSVGYRKSVLEIDYKDDFDGWYFSYRLNVFVGVIWRDWRQHQQRRHIEQELAAARRP